MYRSFITDHNMNYVSSLTSLVSLLPMISTSRGFAPVQHPFYIEASLDGLYLATNMIGPCAEPQFCEELTWLLDKKKLKRLRSSNGHIRVNCYSVVGRHERENVGFVMLSLRSAQIQTDRHPEVTEAWHKLLGMKSSRPELLLCYSIRSASVLPQVAPFITAPTDKEILRCAGDNIDIEPQLVGEQGIIQIGPASIGTDIFLLTVVVGEASHLHLLLPDNQNSQDVEKNTFHFCYTVFGHAIKSKNFSLSLNSDIIAPFNDKITIRIRSSLSVLKTYFNRQSVVPFLMVSVDEEVAFTSIDLKTIIPTERIEEFCSKYLHKSDGVVQNSHCFFSSAKTQQVPIGDDGSKPSVNVTLRFKFVERQVVPTLGLGMDTGRAYTLIKQQSTEQTMKEGDLEQQLCTNSFSAPHFISNPESNKQSVSSHTEPSEIKQFCGLDKPVKNDGVNVSQEVPTASEVVLQQKNVLPPDVTCSEAQEDNFSQSHFEETLNSNMGFEAKNAKHPAHNTIKSIVTERSNTLHCYDLSIFVETVQFHQGVHGEKVFFTFYHPKAEVVCARHAQIQVNGVGQAFPLEGVSCKLSIHSFPSQINHLLLALPTRLSMCSRTTDEQTLVLASTALDSAPLLSTDKRDCCYSKSLRNISTGQQVAIVKVSLLLEDAGLQLMTGDHVRRKIPEYDLGTAAPNDTPVLRMVDDDLDDWKEKQQEIFRAELLQKEKAHLARLTDEWNVKKAELENDIKNDAERYAKMVKDLEHGQEDLRLNREKILEREGEVQLLKEGLQAEWAHKLQELEELGLRMDHDVDKESQWNEEKADLEQAVTTLQQELGTWKETVKLREAELEEVKKCRLTTEQVTYLCQELKLIEEKLQAAMKVKSFYKEQWTRAVKEIFHIKTQNRNSLQIIIRRNERDKLKNLGMIKSLQEAESSHIHDQNILKNAKIKTEKSWLTLPNQLELSDATRRDSQSESSIISLSPTTVENHPMSNKNAQSRQKLEDKLQAMTAERDSLLRTGKYHVNDAAIEKLNQEICVLLDELKN